MSEQNQIILSEREILSVEADRVKNNLLSILEPVLSGKNILSLNLSDLRRDDLMNSLQLVTAVMQSIEQKYTLVKQSEENIKTCENKINEARQRKEKDNAGLKTEIDAIKKLIENKKNSAESEKARLTTGKRIIIFFLSLCSFNTLFISAVIAVILYRRWHKYYITNPTEAGFKKYLEIMEQVKIFEDELNSKTQILNNKLADDDEIKSLQQEKLNAEQYAQNCAAAFQNYINSDEVQWASNALADDYLNYDSLRIFMKYLNTGRADSLKEVINLYETEQHRERLESMQHETLETTQAQLEVNKAQQEMLKAANDIAEDIARTSAENSEHLKNVEKLLKQGQKINVKVKPKFVFKSIKR